MFVFEKRVFEVSMMLSGISMEPVADSMSKTMPLKIVIVTKALLL